MFRFLSMYVCEEIQLGLVGNRTAHGYNITLTKWCLEIYIFFQFHHLDPSVIIESATKEFQSTIMIGQLGVGINPMIFGLHSDEEENFISVFDSSLCGRIHPMIVTHDHFDHMLSIDPSDYKRKISLAEFLHDIGTKASGEVVCIFESWDLLRNYWVTWTVTADPSLLEGRRKLEDPLLKSLPCLKDADPHFREIMKSFQRDIPLIGHNRRASYDQHAQRVLKMKFPSLRLLLEQTWKATTTSATPFGKVIAFVGFPFRLELTRKTLVEVRHWSQTLSIERPRILKYLEERHAVNIISHQFFPQDDDEKIIVFADKCYANQIDMQKLPFWILHRIKNSIYSSYEEFINALEGMCKLTPRKIVEIDNIVEDLTKKKRK